MKRLLVLAMMLCLLIFSTGGATMAEKDPFIDRTYESICENWGTPAASFVTIHIWTDNQGGRFVGAFEPRNSETVLVSYIHLSAEKAYLSGTVLTENTAKNLLEQPYETFVHKDAELFDIGSGLYIPAQISADGYIVYYMEDSVKLYNCFTLSYESAFFFRLKNVYFN